MLKVNYPTHFPSIHGVHQSVLHLSSHVILFTESGNVTANGTRYLSIPPSSYLWKWSGTKK